MDQAKATNVFELRAEIERLELELARSKQREAELEKRVRLSEPLADETRLFLPTAVLESEIGPARKLHYGLGYTAARENEGYASYCDRELGRLTGVDRTSARDVRQALVKLGLWEQSDYVAGTGVYTHRVKSAAEAWELIKRRVVAPDPQQSLWSDWGGGGYSDCQVTEQPVEGVASPGSRMAPEAQSESAGAGDGPPRSLSLWEQSRQIAAARLGDSPRQNPQRPPAPGGFTAAKPPVGERDSEQVGDSPRSIPQQNPQRGKTPSVPDERETPPHPPAGARDTFKELTDVASKSVEPARSSEGVPCKSVSVRSAQDPPAARATVVKLAAELLDPEAQLDRAEQIGRLVALLVREGGQCPPSPRYPGDGRLNPFAARKIAAAVVAGWLDWTDDVVRLLDIGAAKSLADPDQTPAPWVYLVGTVKKIFAERERPWNFNPKSPKPR